MAHKKVRTSKSQISQPLPENDVFTTVPPEIFIKICSYLHPKDLASLNTVCRLFNDYLSSTETSSTSNAIWMNSKKNILPPIDISPPEGMDERRFLMNIYGKRCQKCWEKERMYISVEWEFPLQCCLQCRNSVVKSRTEFSPRVLPILRALQSHACTCISVSDPKRTPKSIIVLEYWLPQVQDNYDEYSQLNTIELKRNFLQSLKERSRKKEAEVSKYKSWEKEYKKKCEKMRIQTIKNRRDTIESRVREMMSECYDDGRKEYKWRWEIVFRLKAYKNALNSTSTNPFTEKSWKLLRKKIENAHYR
ncbi:10315_t:CDS:2 [Ambispora gerdemannii]|uniref:10315_t:CDS:1 n=1 Tax=Ambispora gerdemannii TaxID=144530 RepID=A0A9N8WJW9_9GLOM|nr:10315_t:CDS:2 [Ambispora gerdemannii]